MAGVAFVLDIASGEEVTVVMCLTRTTCSMLDERGVSDLTVGSIEFTSRSS